MKKNHCNNICVIAMFDASCYNKTWGNRYVQPKKNSIAINSKYFNKNFDTIIYIYTHIHIYTVTINNLLIWIFCNNILLLQKSYCNKKKKKILIILLQRYIYCNKNYFMFVIEIDYKIIDIKLL